MLFALLIIFLIMALPLCFFAPADAPVKVDAGSSTSGHMPFSDDLFYNGLEIDISNPEYMAAEEL